MFSIAPARFWDAETNQYQSMVSRSSDVYVFCLLHHQEAATLDPLKMEQWAFYVLPTSVLNDSYPNQKSIGLKALQKITAAVEYDKLREKISMIGAFP